MSVFSKSVFSKSLPEELNMCIGDYLSGTQAQWRIVFQESLELIKRGRYCEPYSHSLKRHTFLSFLRDEGEEYSDEDDYFLDYFSDDEDYDLLV
jgi:hypothetical protein